MGVFEYLLMVVLFLLAIFLIVLVLIQRGKGGGLAGAFGGLGGQSAFGTKAGDLFTRVTIGVAAAWIVLCIISVRFLNASGELLDQGASAATEQQTQTGGGAEPGAVPASPGADGASGSAPASSSSGSEGSTPAPKS